jgi:DNA-binding XRE family transcriptional regulator
MFIYLHGANIKNKLNYILFGVDFFEVTKYEIELVIASLMVKIKNETPNSKELDIRIQKIANKIKQLRIAAGYTNYEYFAYEIEMSRMQYWRLEKGKNMTLETLFTVLDAHKMSLEDFFKGL